VTESNPPPVRADGADSADAALAERIELATRPAAWTPQDAARFRAGVAARVAERAPARRVFRVALAATAACGIAGAVLWATRPAPDADVARAAPAQVDAAESLEDSFEEQLLFAPEWIERDSGFVDSEALPESYALASALLDS
jgi:hypothetical protein